MFNERTVTALDREDRGILKDHIGMASFAHSLLYELRLY